MDLAIASTHLLHKQLWLN